MFITRVLQKVYFNEFSNKNINYNIKKYYKNLNARYLLNSFFII